MNKRFAVVSAVVVSLALVSVVVVRGASANKLFLASEAENATIAVPAEQTAETSSSGGHFVKFRKKVAPPPPPPTSGGEFSAAKTTHKFTTLTEPGQGGTVLDSYYNTAITRLTNNTGSGGLVRYRYSTAQAFNADSSVVYLQKGQEFYDTNTFRKLDYKFGGRGDAVFWSPTDPNLLYTADASSVRVTNPKTNETVKEITLSNYTDADFHVRSNTSYDGKKVVVKAKNKNDGKWYAVGVNIETGAIGPELKFDDYGFGLCEYSGSPNESKSRNGTATPSGSMILLMGCQDGEIQQFVAVDWNSGVVTYDHPSNKGIECTGGHGDIAMNDKGEDVYVGICKGSGEAWSQPYWGDIIVINLRGGGYSSIDLNGLGMSHTSARNSSRPGWAYGSSYKDSGAILAYKLDGSRVEYYADPQSQPEGWIGYDAETHATPSPDGRKVLFMSTWRNQLGDGNVYLLNLDKL